MPFQTMMLSIPYWSYIALASALGVALAGLRMFESEATKAKRTKIKTQRDLRALAHKISTYAQTVHQQFPSAEVVVSERDLAEQLRKRPEAVVSALNLLLNEHKVQHAPLPGYWKLNKQNRETHSTFVESR